MHSFASVVLNWILFLALFPISFIWFRRAWNILIRRDYSEVALKKGESPPQPEKFAIPIALTNGVGSIVLAFNILGVLFVGLPFETWSAVAGVTIWSKFMIDFLVSRHAHSPWFNKSIAKSQPIRK